MANRARQGRQKGPVHVHIVGCDPNTVICRSPGQGQAPGSYVAGGERASLGEHGGRVIPYNYSRARGSLASIVIGHGEGSCVGSIGGVEVLCGSASPSCPISKIPCKVDHCPVGV